MTDIIGEFFFGNLDLSMLEAKRDSEYNRKREEITKMLDALAATHAKEASELMDAVNDLDVIASREYFSLGFRWGARMMLAIMNESGDTFKENGCQTK